MTHSVKALHIFVIVAILCALFTPFLALAQGATFQPGGTGSSSGCTGNNCLQNPLQGSGTNNIFQLLAKILDIVIKLGIPIAVLFIVWAGFKFVTAQGSEDKLKEAKKNLAYTLLGIAIFIASALLVKIIEGTLTRLGV